MTGALSTWIAKTVMAIVKGQPSGSDVHVPAPLGSKEDRVRKFDTQPPLDNLEATILKAALEESEQTPAPKSEPAPDPPAAVAPKPGERRIATVAVRHGDHLLMGKRRDNGKWTVPGGHVDPGEDFHQGAVRELAEESGITAPPEHVKPLGEPERKKAHGGGDTIHVQPYMYDLAEKPKTSMREDPDGEVYRWHWVDVSEGLPAHIQKDLHVPAEHNTLMHRLGLCGGEEPVEKDQGNDPGDVDDLHQLVSGMDWEMGTAPGLEEDDARELALVNLADDPGYYRALRVGNHQDETEECPFAEDGLCLDLASGQSREPGFLGVDTYPYDHGTVVHDLTQGVPFADESASTIMLRNAPDLDLDDSAYDLFDEIQRVLKPGGQFIHEGAEALPEDVHPGLVQTRHDVSQVQKEGGDAAGWHRQYFTRLDPATANDAEPRVSPAQGDDLQTADEALAQVALSYYLEEAEPVQKSGAQPLGTRLAKIVKMSSKLQVAYCVVLSPEEMDEDEDFMLAPDILKACHYYMENSRVIGSNHTKQISACPVECYCAPIDFEMDGGPYGPQLVKKGAWVIGIKVYDAAEWAKIESGEYQGVSVSGFGHRDKMQMN